MRVIPRIVLLVALSVATAHHADASQISLGEANGWDINYEDGVSKLCAARGTYEGGTTISVLHVGPDRHWVFVITNPKWRSVVKDREYQTQYIFNQRRVWKGADSGIENGLASYSVKEEFIEDFARSSTLEIRLGAETIDRISLRGTRAAVNALKSCYADRIDNHDPFAGQARSNDAPAPGVESDIDLKQLTTFSGKCRYRLFTDFMPCKDAVMFLEHQNGRIQVIFVSDEVIYSLSGGSDRQPNLNNYYIAIDTLRLAPSGSADKPIEDPGMEGECHLTLNDGATEFYFIKCDVYNRAKGMHFSFSLQNITGFDRKDL